MRRLGLFAVALVVAAVDLFPLALVVKQAVTPERESFAWPPTWVPHALTADNFRGIVSAFELGRGFLLSLLVAGLTVASTLSLALPAAWFASRMPHRRRALDAGLTAARLFPSIAIAIPLAATFVRLGLYDHPAGVGLWLAHTLLAIPFAFFVLRTAAAALPPELEEAARLDGATAAGAFIRVTLPVMRPALAAAGFLVFLVSWDEFAYALLLQVTRRPLPPLLYYLAAFGHPGLASAVAVVMLAPALLFMMLLAPAFRAGVLAGSGR